MFITVYKSIRSYKPPPSPKHEWNSVATGSHSEMGQRFGIKVTAESDLPLPLHIPLSSWSFWVLGFVLFSLSSYLSSSLLGLCAHACRYLGRPEEGIRVSEARVTGTRKPPFMRSSEPPQEQRGLLTNKPSSSTWNPVGLELTV